MPTPPPDFSPLTASLVEFCEGLVSVLNTNLAELAYNGNPGRVFYGEQNRYPTVPAYAVEPVVKERDTENVRMQRVYELHLTAQVIGYLVRVDASDQTVRKDVDRLAEKVEEILHRDHTLGGLVRDLVVTSLESGHAYKEETKYKAVILTVEGLSREGLPC